MQPVCMCTDTHTHTFSSCLFKNTFCCQHHIVFPLQIVQNCNEDARKMERMEEILILSRQLYFPNEVKAVPIISSVRWLVRKGELTHLVWRGDEGKLTFGKKFSRIQIHMFLFTDLLVITKKKR